ncbi:MAG: aldo/keto reductase, partial [Deltaproteobacteria bacterium]|nr:aldo/keto reductase [Deltaproteobacteria bacterium]
FNSSLKNLHTDTIDSYLLHGPDSHPGLGEEDWEVWQTMEEIVQSGKAKQIGISNVNHQQLALLVAKATIKPTVVQNRCYANRGWDKEVREICRANGITYQGFSLLTANPFVWQNPQVRKIAERLNKTPMQVIFRFAIQIGMTPLTGTTDPQHMKEDLEVFDFALTPEEVGFIEMMAE